MFWRVNLIATAALLLSACASTPPPSTSSGPLTVHLLGINDFHGNLEAPRNGLSRPDPADPTKVLLKAGQLLPAFGVMRDDGKTSGGCWIYTGSWTQAGNQMARRDAADPSGLGNAPGWAWSWPANRRILYNRASADANGKPWDPSRKYLAWNGTSWAPLGTGIGGPVPFVYALAAGNPDRPATVGGRSAHLPRVDGERPVLVDLHHGVGDGARLPTGHRGVITQFGKITGIRW